MIKRATARWPVVLLFVVFTEAITLTSAQTPETAGILRPTDQAVLETEEVQVIARPGELWLDGKSLKERQTQAMRQALSLRIPAGRHELIWKNGDTSSENSIHCQNLCEHCGSARVESLQGASSSGRMSELSRGKGSREFSRRSPLQRHASRVTSKSTFAAGHAHNDEVLAECVLCHNPHGSTEKFHLKMTRETACKQCHG